MKKSKLATTSSRNDGVDIISRLPDPILHLILSRLPTTEEDIRTSILSKRWRHLWTSTPNVDIDCYRVLKPLNKFESKRFAKFVDWVLANKSLDLDTFRLCCSKYYSMSTIERWVQIAVMRRVKLVDLMFCPNEESQDVKVPNCLMTCGSLEVLRLFLFKRRLSLPNFTGFPALRVLEFNNVELIDYSSVKHFLENCPFLEELSFIQCTVYELPYLRISCPKLKKLRIDNQNTDNDWFVSAGVWISCPKLVLLEFSGHIADSFSFENLDSLKKVVIHTESSFHRQHSLFALMSHAEFLSLSHFFIQGLHVPISLPNLKTLELTTTFDAKTMDVLIKFLIWFPHLESLHLIIQEGYFGGKHWKLDEEETRRILAPRLKRVEFLDFNGEYWKLVLVYSLLKHGNVLEEMVFNWDNYEHDKLMKIMKEVSKFPKASSTVKLITRIKD